MIPAEFNYEVADSVDHALSLLDSYGPEAKLLQGLLLGLCGLAGAVLERRVERTHGFGSPVGSPHGRFLALAIAQNLICAPARYR